MLETGTVAAVKPQRARRAGVAMRPTSRAAVSNDPLAGFNGNTAEGRRARDLFRLAAAELGGRLSVRERLLIQNWLLLQLRFEVGEVLLAAELRHAWKAITALKRGPRKAERREANGQSGGPRQSFVETLKAAPAAPVKQQGTESEASAEPRRPRFPLS